MIFYFKGAKRINRFIIEGDKFMPEMHLIQPACTCSASRIFTKNKKKHTNLKKQEVQDIFIETN